MEVSTQLLEDKTSEVKTHQAQRGSEEQGVDSEEASGGPLSSPPLWNPMAEKWLPSTWWMPSGGLLVLCLMGSFLTMTPPVELHHQGSHGVTAS